jgi:thiamine-phosphate diphosphorylase
VSGGFPALHLVTDDGVLAGPGFALRAAELLENGGARLALHLRGPATPAARLYELARGLAPTASRSGAWLLVNDRADIAAAAGASGVQLGARSMDAATVRRLLGADARIGVSVHGPREARAAAEGGADFLVAGTLFATASHPGRAGQGTAWLGDLAALGPPVVGIGGITPGRVPEVLAAGATGVAVVRGVWAAGSAGAAARAYLRMLEEGHGYG